MVHLDGARLWNACVATGTGPRDWTAGVDSVSVCFSKGLGAPVGSAVCGAAEFVKEARFIRKMFGGQMRQAGIIAAGALYALEHHRERLHEDHANARLLAALVDQAPGLQVRPAAKQHRDDRHPKRPRRAAAAPQRPAAAGAACR